MALTLLTPQTSVTSENTDTHTLSDFTVEDYPNSVLFVVIHSNKDSDIAISSLTYNSTAMTVVANGQALELGDPDTIRIRMQEYTA